METFPVTKLFCIIITILFASCIKNTENTKPKDSNLPVISLKGNRFDSLAIGALYLDIGATAFDDKDGDITTKIVSSSNYNPYLKGNYKIEYNVADQAGNKANTINRFVKVINNVDCFSGTYSAFCSNTVNTFPTITQPTITYYSYTTTANSSDEINNTFRLNYFPLNESYLDLSVKEESGKLILFGSGTGTVSTDKKSFNLNRIENFPVAGTTKTCSCSFVKK